MSKHLIDDWKHTLTSESQTWVERKIVAAMQIPASEHKRPPNAKLTPEMVMELRYGPYRSLRDLGAQWGISPRTLSECLHYITFRDLP